jgi:hypothetical protein
VFRVSLRELLLLVALTAAAAASLRYASDGWLALISALAMLALFAAAIVAIVDRGQRQAFAIGFAIVLAGYHLLLINGEFMPGARAPTTMSLTLLHESINQNRWINSDTGEELPNFDHKETPQRIRVVNGRGIPIEQFVEHPPRKQLMQIGHAWWSMLLAYAGGRFASFVFSRRDNVGSI